MVHGAVADAVFLHAAHDGLEGVQVFAGVAVQLHIADVPGVGQRVVGGLDLDFAERPDGEVHRHMERVGVVFAVGHARNHAVFFLVDFHEAAGKALRRRRQQGEVQAGLGGFVVHALAHVADNPEAELLACLALAVMLARQGLEGFGQADEADAQCAVLEHFGHAVGPLEPVAAEPHALAHQKRIVVDFLGALNFEAVQELADHQVDAPVQNRIELFHVAVRLNADARQVDGGEAQVAAAAGYLAASVVDVAHHAGAAAHVGDFRIVVAGFVVLQVEGRVQKAEVWEQPFGAHLDGELEEVVVRVAGVVVHALFDLENLDGENRGLALAEAGFRRQQQVFHHHPAFGRRVGAVVQRAERHLRARAGVHGVQVVNQRFHGLVGGALRNAHGVLHGEGMRALRLLRGDGLEPARLLVRGEVFPQLFAVPVGAAHRDAGADVFFHRFGQRLRVPERHAVNGLDVFCKLLKIDPAERLGHAGGHAVIEVGDALPAVHLVLVGLDGNAGQRRVGADVLRLAQGAVPRAEPAVEQLEQVDLAAGLGQHVKVFVVDVDVAADVRRRDVLGQNIVVDKVLRAFGAVLQHGAHGGVGVDVGVLALEVHVLRVAERELAVDVHQVALRLADFRVLRAVQDVRLGRLCKIGRNQALLHHVLHLLHGGDLFAGEAAGHFLRQAVQHLFGHGFVLDRAVCLQNCVADFSGVKVHDRAVALPDFFCHPSYAPYLKIYLYGNRVSRLCHEV